MASVIQENLRPDLDTGIKLASLAVHVEEMLSHKGHDHDRIAIEGLLQDPDVRSYIEALDSLALVPKKR